jgi:phosphate transport system substrate-binding protein
MNLHAEVGLLTGAGATVPSPLFIKWAELYYQKFHLKINYQPIGSGGGIRQVIAGTIDFAATDKPLTQKELDHHQLIQFPAILNAIVPIMHLSGVQKEALHLTGPILADIFLGDVTYWDDPKITDINPNQTLPHLKITVIHRADSAGSTLLWTRYLSEVSTNCKTKVGIGASVRWPVGIGGKGGQGVALFVKKIPGAIGYVDYTDVLENQLTYPKLLNHDGQYVSPSKESINASSLHANWENPSTNLSHQSSPNSWPITGASFILIKKNLSPDKKYQILAFFRWAFQEGQFSAEKLHYISLPLEAMKSWEENEKTHRL